ncbi:MAG: xanthine dehydrogenase family protein molybdopterin-binding subunit [Streptosporangiaceae bacterium]|nr:xanthine dehydrogenase family protein molybdopterin-binding subunit [Streptosporangiaceae bacterium]
MPQSGAASILGTRITRVEDRRLLTAGATYVEDLRLPELRGAAFATFVRSPLAHARITGVDASMARAQPGVAGVVVADDIGGPDPRPTGPDAEPLLAASVALFAGEPVALVLTDDHYGGADAAELVNVDYEPLEAVVGIEAALRDEVLVCPGAGSNVVARGGTEASSGLFHGCDVVVERVLVNQRVAAVPLEVRAAAAVWEDERLTVWLSTQNAQACRDTLARRLGLAPAAVRVIAPDVGGGFGAKIGVDREAVVVGWAARRFSRPVRWVETRSENLMAMTHGRAQRHTVGIGGTRDGRILAYRLDIVQDCGAYVRMGASLPAVTALMAAGVYGVPRVEAAYQAVLTNTAPIGAYRGAGRPEATAAIERAVDLFAAEIGIDPAEIRRRNIIPPDRFPYTTPTGAVYDTGEYAKALDAVLDAAGYRRLRAEQRRRRERGAETQIGIGLAAYVAVTGGAPTLGETASLTIGADGRVTIRTGSSSQGQGHATAWAMLVHDELGVPMDAVTVQHGDTAAIPDGIGTYGSRSLQLGGTAVGKAAAEVKKLARALAARELRADPAGVVLDTATGTWNVAGTPGKSVGWARLAERAGPGGLSAATRFAARHGTFPSGAHVAVVEVDTATGAVRLVRHVTVDDAGRVINPILAEGQRHGGIAQGVAQALMEEIVYDESGSPVTATLMDYSVITAADLPSFELIAMETPTSRNPLGVKGIGEAGTIGAAPAVQNAVVDALAHLGVRHIDMPATPGRVWAAISEARANTGRVKLACQHIPKTAEES